MAQQSSGMEFLCREYLKNNYIDPETSERLGVKRNSRMGRILRFMALNLLGGGAAFSALAFSL